MNYSISALAIPLALLMGAHMSFAETGTNICRYSLSNLAENHCVDEQVRSYQDDLYFSVRTPDNDGKLPLEDQWNWCTINNLLSVVECTFLIRPDLNFMQNQINKEITRLMNLDYLSTSSKRELEASQVMFQDRLDVVCSIPEQSSFSGEWDERIFYGDEICRLTHYAERLMFLSNQYENP